MSKPNHSAGLGCWLPVRYEEKMQPPLRRHRPRRFGTAIALGLLALALNGMRARAEDQPIRIYAAGSLAEVMPKLIAASGCRPRPLGVRPTDPPARCGSAF